MFEINVLVNGNKCKKYSFNEKIYIEGKFGSEYELEIKNNTWRRVLALTSVDGLNVLDGTTMSDESPGYVISAYSPLKIKGFRYSNDEVASFKFTDKQHSYAKNIGGNEAAQNCGVIGFKIWNEYIKPQPNYNWQYDWNYIPSIHGTYWVGDTLNPIWGDIPNSDIIRYCGDVINSSLSANASNCNSDIKSKRVGLVSTNVKSPKLLRSFDMGSTWGKKIESKVIETEFEKNILTFSLDIYYASRFALIKMGVPLTTNNQITFPRSFPKKYATPPDGWSG